MYNLRAKHKKQKLALNPRKKNKQSTPKNTHTHSCTKFKLYVLYIYDKYFTANANLTKFEQHFALCFWFNNKKKENMKMIYMVFIISLQIIVHIFIYKLSKLFVNMNESFRIDRTYRIILIISSHTDNNNNNKKTNTNQTAQSHLSLVV